METSRSLHGLIMGSSVASDMRAGKLITAGWLMSGDWKTARAMARHHDLVVIDAEHGAISINDIALCLEVLAGNMCLGVVRVPYDSDSRKQFARRALDAGAIGILFPNVQSAAEAEICIKNCYYPCAEGVSGTRGFGYGGCNHDGAEFAAYASAANSKIVVGVQLENTKAFSEGVLLDIFSVAGLCFTQDGPYDHSGSHLVPGSTSDPRVLSELRLYREVAKRSGIPAGKHVVRPTPAAVKSATAEGYTFLALGTDALHIQEGCRRALDDVVSGL